jgi:O-antigen/teichoic acid export membrane protein
MILCLGLVAKEFIVVALGEKWADSGVLLQILCIGGAFTPLYGIYQSLIISCGRSDIYMWGCISQIFVQLLIVLTLFQYGITTIVWGYSILNIFWLIIWQVIANRLFGIKHWDVIKDISPFLAITVTVLFVAHELTFGIDNNVILLTTRVFIVGILYLGTMKLLKVKIFEECSNFIISKLTLTKHQ